MTYQRLLHLITALIFFCVVTGNVQAQGGPDLSQYEWVEVVSGFDNPIYISHAGDGSGRLFVLEQTGYIFILDQDLQVLPDPFLDVSGLLTSDVFQGGYSERGLLGIAFHPDFENNGIFFIHYIRYDNKAIVERHTVSADDPNLADPASAAVILSVDDPFPNHNGGQLAFGPDGYLYIGIGDGGDLGDPLGNGQNTKTLLGKILRVDVNNTDTYTVPETNPFVGNDDYAPEIWALGFRNPWRFSFDRATGDLYIGDVGESTWEEINFQPADSPGGQNYGWNAYEGNHPFNEDTPVPDEMTLPIAEYSHNEGCSVTAGYVYRGEMMPELQGVFFFGDYCTGGVWATQPLTEGIWLTANYGYLGHQITSFGEDEAGELYLADYKGGIYQLQPIE